VPGLNKNLKLENAIIHVNSLHTSASQVKDILIKLNFEDVWTNQKVLNYSSFIQDIKERVKLLFIQETNTRLINSTRAVVYKHIRV